MVDRLKLGDLKGQRCQPQMKGRLGEVFVFVKYGWKNVRLSVLQ
jgi:hypothetical protein